MPAMSKRDCGLILFDVASSKKSELLNGLLKFASFRWFMNSKSIYRLILVNSAQTQNDRKYPNIYTTDLDDFDPKLIVQEIENMQPGKSNWVDALRLAIYHLEEAVEMRGIVTLQLIFFTSFDSNITPAFDETAISGVINSINKYEQMYLYFIGPDVTLPFAITSQSSVPKCMKELQINKSNQNLVVAHRIVTNVKNAIMCNTKIGTPHLLITFKNNQGSQPWKIPFTFGSKLSIPAITTKIIRKDISLKLFSPMQRTYVKTLADNREVQVDEADIVRGLIRHGKFLKIDETQFKIETERCFEIMGFTEKTFLPETYMKGDDTFYVLPNGASKDGFQAFTHLVKILHETGKYAVGKRIYATNNKARYFVLIPKVDFVPKCFIMTALPYADFLVPHKVETPLQPKEKLKQDDFHRFFKSLIIENKDCKAGISLGPTMMMDIYQQKVIDAAAKKKVRREDFDLESLDVCDHESVVDNKFLENLRTTWPVRSMDSPTKR